jgi:hypothetical protein
LGIKVTDFVDTLLEKKPDITQLLSLVEAWENSRE